MSDVATCKIGSGKERDVLFCIYEIARTHDQKGNPTGAPTGGKITLEVESTDDSSVIEAMQNSHKPIDGTVTFMNKNKDGKMKELTWKNGHVVQYSERMDPTGEHHMIEKFTITANEIGLGKAKFNFGWPDVKK